MKVQDIDIDHPTQKQHYVPRLYLKHWCSPDGHLAVATKGQVRDRETTMGHAYSRFYYEAEDLTPEELQCLYDDVSRSFPVYLFSKEKNIVRYLFAKIYLVILGYRYELSDDISRYKGIFEAIESRWPLSNREIKCRNQLLEYIREKHNFTDDVAKVIHYCRRMIFERYEYKIEREAMDLLDRAVTGDISFMKNPLNAFSFLHYVLNQSTRVPDYISYLKSKLPSQVEPNGATIRTGGYIRYFLPLCSALQLIQPNARENHKVCLITNNTGHEFITGDVPTVVVGADQDIMKFNVGYYPLSPHRAIVYGFRNAVNEFRKVAHLTDELKDVSIAKLLNSAILKNCTNEVFASSGTFLIENKYCPNLSPSRRTKTS